jgi:hypothetical protein
VHARVLGVCPRRLRRRVFGAAGRRLTCVYLRLGTRWVRVCCGRYWDRTSDLFRVREARYRCANRPRFSRVSEVETGFEPVYTALQAVASPLGHSTSEKAGLPNPLRADDRVRTGDLNLGKVALYQLSYVRIAPAECFRSVREQNSSALLAFAKPDSAVSRSRLCQRGFRHTSHTSPTCRQSPDLAVRRPRRADRRRRTTPTPRR